MSVRSNFNDEGSMKLADINQFGPMIGMNSALEGVTLLEIWQGIHHRALHWNLPPEGKTIEEHQFSISFDDRNTCIILEENVLSKHWYSLCNSIGMTVYGAASLSWCKDAEPSQVWESWLASNFPLKPLPEFERPARFINPALMPQSNKLSGILEILNNRHHDSSRTYSLAICASIAASKEPLEFDISAEKLATATPQIASFLKSRMLQKPEQTAEEATLVKTWTEAIKGTEFDIWEGS